jgi:FKBP-type peptidyl-prolyl cis-trans isomerase
MKTKLIWGIIIFLFVAGNIIYFSPGKLEFVDTNPKPTLAKLDPSNTEKVQIKDIKVGEGEQAKAGSTVSVHYKGTLSNGKEFDNSYTRNEPLTFTIDNGDVIKGWDEGIKGMKVGGKRILTIPPSLGYGKAGNPPTIPSNATLTFEVELVQIK